MAQLLHLKLERPGSNEDANERGVCDDLKSVTVRENAGDSTGYTREPAEEKDDNELDEIEDRETEEALKWLGAEWDSLAKILRQRDPEIY